MTERIVITGIGAICAAGRSPEEIWAAADTGVSAIGEVTDWNRHGSKVRAGSVKDFNPLALVADRKLHKWLHRTDLFGIYAAERAIDQSGIAAAREGFAQKQREEFNDRTAIFVGSGAGNYQNQYEFFPLMKESEGSLKEFGKELSSHINPMWLLQALPNNVLCHLGIRSGFKGPNACITNSGVGGSMAIVEAAEAIAAGDAARAVAVGHEAPIEPQYVQYFRQLGLYAEQALRPFDASHGGTILGEGAAALVLETEHSALSRAAPTLGVFVGGACASEDRGLLALRADGDGLTRAIRSAFESTGIAPRDIGVVVAHGNGNRPSDDAEIAALRAVFGSSTPPVTSFKWLFGHLLAASGPISAVMALLCLRSRIVPGIATLKKLDPQYEGMPISRNPQEVRGDLALVLSRGYTGTSAAIVLGRG
ncbi:MAG TPA: beta-ketoacyl synthase N-terminal-like domain-containing protein [Candidatus Binataceae bacterium]